MAGGAVRRGGGGDSTVRHVHEMLIFGRTLRKQCLDSL